MSSLNTGVKETLKPQRNWLPMLIGTGVLSAVLIVSWIVQLSQGMESLGVSQVIPWGLYIVIFFLLAGVGGGMMILAACADLGLFPSLRKYSRKFMVAALACFIPAGIMILMDLGQPARVLNFLFHPNFKSMFIWDFYFLVIAVVLSSLLIFIKPKKILSFVSGLAGAAVIIVEGLILTRSVGSPLWHSTLVPVTFLVEGLVAALAITLIVIRKEAIRALTGTLAALLTALLIFSLIDLVSTGISGNTAVSAGFRILVSGSLAPMYWGQIVLGLVLPIILLVWIKSPLSTMVAGALAFIGVLVLKFDLIIAGQAIDSLGVQAGYSPTLVEICGLIGAFGMAAFIFVVVSKIFDSTAK